MMRLLVTLIFAFSFHLSYPQDPGFFTVSGTVKDAETGKPVPFASISFEEGFSGIVSNPDGEFSLTISSELKSDHSRIMISHIGYRRSYFALEGIEGSRGDFLLVPQTVHLTEVTIRPADARSIVAESLDRIGDNYPLSPLRLTGFYRETIKQRRDYVSITEALVDIYKAPYDSQGNDLLRIVRGRKSGNIKQQDTLLVKLQGGPHVSLLLDVVKNRDLLFEGNLGHYFFEIEDIVIIDDTPHYAIVFGPRVKLNYPLYYGKLFITVNRKALTMAEFSLDLSDKAKAVQSFILRKPARLRFIPESTRYLVHYKEVEGRYYIDYIRYELEFSADWRRRLFRTGYTIMSEMAVTAREPLSGEKFAFQEAFLSSSVLADLVPVYFHDEFWDGYNYIEPEQSIHDAIRRLNRRLDDW